MKGSKRVRGKNSWELTIDLGRDANGRRRRKFLNVKGKAADADRKLREVLASLDRGLPLDTSKLTVAEYLARWHRDYAIPNTGPRTAERYMGDIRNHLIPNLGHFPLTKVSPSDVQAMEAAMLAGDLSPSSVQHAHRVLSEAFRHAIEWGLMWSNPCAAVRPPRLVRKEISIPDAATVQNLLEAAKATPHHPAFHFLAYTGARRGEACGLMWADLDLNASRASIRRAAVRVKGEGVVMLPPKTKRGRRSISLDADTVAMLRAHRGTQLIHQAEPGSLYENSGYVFARPTGGSLDPNVLTDTWRRLVAKVGVSHVRLHDLRHFHASILLQANTHPKVVQERLGHATISITLDTYSHSIPALQAEAANDFARLMRDTS